jgi:Na+/phosphate symporter
VASRIAHGGEITRARRGSVPRAISIGSRVAYSVGGVFLFVLALELLKSGASGIEPILDGVNASGAHNLLGFGWIGAYLVMSGSPVAAIGLSLFAGGTISDIEALAILNGSRLGASFIVLAVGFALYASNRRTADGLYIGVVALLTAFTLWLPVLPLGVVALESGWFDSIELSRPGFVTSFVDAAYDPIVDPIAENVTGLLVFAGGIGLLLVAFVVFDRALPNLEQPSLRVERVKDWLHHPIAMFTIGLLLTMLTLSVSISLTLLIPLSLKGYIRRSGIIPYVMGANISTWVDTMVAALLLDAPHAFTIVFVQMIAGAALSLAVLLFVYKPYSNTILSLATRITHTKRSFALFMGAIFFVPLVLFLV